MKTTIKTIKKAVFALSLCIIGLSLKAQYINDFYHFNGLPSDHGQGSKVITTKAAVGSTAGGYVVGGTGNSTNTTPFNTEWPAVFLSKYDPTGNPLWHRTFLVNQPQSTDVVTVEGLVEAYAASTPGFGVLVYSNSSPAAQSLLIKTDESGVLLWKVEVGSEQASSLAYDQNLNRFLVLTHVTTSGNTQLQLVVIDANSGAIVYSHFVDGLNGSKDTPAAVLYDANTASYILIGSSEWTSQCGGTTTEKDLVIARLSNSGSLIYTHVFGLAGVQEGGCN